MPPDSVTVGNVCIDTYEASARQIDPASPKLVKKLQDGKASPTDLTKGWATQLSVENLGVPCGPDFPENFASDGNWTPMQGSNPPSPGVYAASVPGVIPTACVTWFQPNRVPATPARFPAWSWPTKNPLNAAGLLCPLYPTDQDHR